MTPNYLRHPVVGYKVDVSDIPEEEADGRLNSSAGSAGSNHHHHTLPKQKKAPPTFKILKVSEWTDGRHQKLFTMGYSSGERPLSSCREPLLLLLPRVRYIRTPGFNKRKSPFCQCVFLGCPEWSHLLKICIQGHGPIKEITMDFFLTQVRLVGKPEFDRDFIEIDVPTTMLSFRNLIDIICEEFSINPKTIIKLRKLPNTKLRRDIEVVRLEDYQELEAEVLDI